MQKLSEFDNKGFNPGNIVRRVIWYIIHECFFDNFLPFPNILKKGILVLFGAKVGRNVVIKPKVKIKYPWHLKIGNNSWIGEKVWIDNLAEVIIGNDVCISQGALIITGSHDYKEKSFGLIVKSIIIEDHVWICAKAVVGPGVNCMAGSVLSLGSVATSNLEENSIYRGNPAVKIKDRNL